MNYLLYRIYYGDEIVYVGQTTQKLQDRLRGHFFKKPMMRSIDIHSVSKIEFATPSSRADMDLYEVYYINKLHPMINCDKKNPDDLSVILPELKWEIYECKLMEKWRADLQAKDAFRTKRKKLENEWWIARGHARMKYSGDEFKKWLEENKMEEWIKRSIGEGQ